MNAAQRTRGANLRQPPQQARRGVAAHERRRPVRVGAVVDPPAVTRDQRSSQPVIVALADRIAGGVPQAVVIFHGAKALRWPPCEVYRDPRRAIRVPLHLHYRNTVAGGAKHRPCHLPAQRQHLVFYRLGYLRIHASLRDWFDDRLQLGNGVATGTGRAER